MDGGRATMLVLLLLSGIVLNLAASAATSWTQAGQEEAGETLLQGPPGGGGAGGGGEEGCPAVCVCKHGKTYYKAECTARNLSEVPVGLSVNITAIDLSMNTISDLPPFAFSHLKNLQEIRLIGNHIKTLPANVFGGLRKLASLHLQENLFTRVPSEALKGLYRLEKLQLDACHIRVVPEDSFRTLTNLTMLWLDHNNLTSVPHAALNRQPSLAALTLALNFIETVPNQAFVNLTRLAVLLLSYNRIHTIGDYAFEGLHELKMLELHGNRLKHVPVSLASLPRLTELNLAENDINYLPDDCFRGNKELTLLQLKKNPIHSVGRYAFSSLPKLNSLILSEARDQVDFPDLSGTHDLVTLTLDRGNIKFIPSDICTKLHKLKSFDIHSNSITVIPDMSGCHDLRTLNLGNNELMSLSGRPFQGLSQLRDLTLSHNLLQHIPETAFANLTQLQYLDLQHNRIDSIHPDAFVPLQNLEDLNLGDNQFSVLPTRGLEKLKNLKTFGNKRLKDFPPPETFPRIQRLTLSYAYHCCQFIQEKPKEHEQEVKLKEDITWLSKDPDNTFWRNLTNIWGPLENISDNYHNFVEDIWDSFGTDEGMDYPDDIPKSAANYFNDYRPRMDAEDIIIARPPVLCKPMPGPFMPCDDLMGWWSLRCGVWIVFLLALLGNGTVLLVSMVSRTKMDVPRFLICNLAFADFFMGIYLGFLAIVDASTLGEFKKHAIAWQTSFGCQMAGFLGVLSSELSVFTLTVITLERFYAITHAMHLNKRLSLRHAGYIMACGWFLAVLLATMPLFGVSDYRKFAICLPFEISDSVSLGYVCFIMFLNCLAFGIIVSCYTKMYCSIRGSQAWNSNDSRVAKRMALLVFTDFACWAPISFFSLTAAFGLELISLNDAKIFTIFVLPLNSCANPFLYAIFTKQFKKDCTQICKRLEESAMSRSLSRFSNRNLSISWGSSRRPSLLNSFFNVEKRMSRSNSISGASAAQLEGNGLNNSSTRATNGSSGRILPDRPLPEVAISTAVPATANGSANPIRQVYHKRSCCFSNNGKEGDGEAAGLNGTGPMRCTCHRANGILRSAVREGPVGAGSALLALIRHKKGSDKLGDGADSDQEEGHWHGHDDQSGHRDTLGLFPLLPLGESPGGARRPRDHHPTNHRHSATAAGRSPRVPPRNNQKSSKTPSPSGHKKITLNCCNGSPRESMRSPGPEYQLMRPREESSFDTDGLPTTGGDPSSSDQSCYSAMMNNNHEYVNITEDMINELQRIRSSSSTSPPVDSSDTSHEHKSQPPSPRPTRHNVTTTEVEVLPVPPTEELEEEPTNVRLDPEGSETKEKVPMRRFQALPTFPWRGGCRCNQPHCKDKRLADARRQKLAQGRSQSVDSPGGQLHFSGPGCSLSRQLWLSSTEQDFAGACGGSTSSLPVQTKRDNLKKSNSFDCDTVPVKGLPGLSKDGTSCSLPGLTDLVPIVDCRRSESAPQGQLCNNSESDSTSPHSPETHSPQIPRIPGHGTSSHRPLPFNLNPNNRRSLSPQTNSHTTVNHHSSDPHILHNSRAETYRPNSHISHPETSNSSNSHSPNAHSSDVNRIDLCREDSHRPNFYSSDPHQLNRLRTDTRGLNSHHSDSKGPDHHNPDTYRPNTHSPDTHRSNTHSPDTHRTNTHRTNHHSPDSHGSNHCRTNPNTSNTHRSNPNSPNTHRSNPNSPNTHRSNPHSPNTHKSNPHRSDGTGTDPQCSPQNPDDFTEDLQDSELTRDKSVSDVDLSNSHSSTELLSDRAKVNTKVVLSDSVPHVILHCSKESSPTAEVHI